MNRYFYIVFVVAAICVAAQIVYHFTSKRDPSISVFEKSLWQFGLATVFFAVLMLVSYVYLPYFFTRTIPVAGQSTEVVLQRLVDNQQRLNQELEDFREVISVVFLLTGLYALSAIKFLTQWRSEEKKSRVSPRPLGLELD